MEGATAVGDPIFVPTICVVEITYLVEKQRIGRGALAQLEEVLREPSSAFVPAPLTAEISFALKQVARDVVPDMPDRVIAATALTLILPLITRDTRIRALPIQTIW
jgi:predicted nucleic acid-binding protein